MKNIHVLPTEKPIRLYLTKEGFYFLLPNIKGNDVKFQHIYITSDEEIREGDYSFYPPFGVGKNIFIDGELCFHIESKDGKGSFTQKTYQTLDRNKKIILTTDQSLDSVQKIDDDFLEWFVKNPSCDRVKVEKESHIEIEEVSYEGDFQNVEYISYKIIVPQEEPKQYTSEELEGFEVFKKLINLNKKHLKILNLRK